jgi:hypothetical protein
VVGVAITAETAVRGCQPNASHEVDIDLAACFALQSACRFGAGDVRLHDAEACARILAAYGSLAHLAAQPTPG